MIQPFPDHGYFKGEVKINVTWQETSKEITFHAHQDLKISLPDLKVTKYVADDET